MYHESVISHESVYTKLCLLQPKHIFLSVYNNIVIKTHVSKWSQTAQGLHSLTICNKNTHQEHKSLRKNVKNLDYICY